MLTCLKTECEAIMKLDHPNIIKYLFYVSYTP